MFVLKSFGGVTRLQAMQILYHYLCRSPGVTSGVIGYTFIQCLCRAYDSTLGPYTCVYNLCIFSWFSDDISCTNSSETVITSSYTICMWEEIQNWTLRPGFFLSAGPWLEVQSCCWHCLGWVASFWAEWTLSMVWEETTSVAASPSRVSSTRWVSCVN